MTICVRNQHKTQGDSRNLIYDKNLDFDKTIQSWRKLFWEFVYFILGYVYLKYLRYISKDELVLCILKTSFLSPKMGAMEWSIAREGKSNKGFPLGSSLPYI